MKNIKIIKKILDSKFICWLKKSVAVVKSFIKAKCSPGVSFLHEGKMGAVIALGLVSVIYFSFELRELFKFVPLVWRLFASALIIPLLLYLINLIFKLIFKKTYPAQITFIIDYILIVSFIPRGGTGFVLGVILFLLSLDFLGRCLYSFFVKKGRSLLFWIITPLSCLLVAGGIFFISCKGFSRNNVKKYFEMQGQLSPAPEGFEKSISKGSYEVESLTYGYKDSDIATATCDISAYANRNGFGGKVKKFYFKYGLDEVPLAGKIWLPKNVEKAPVLFIIHGNHSYPVRSYLGYDYLGEFLASWGYALISVDEQSCNDLWGENDGRAILLLENIKKIMELNAWSESPLYNRLDMENIALAGHSRGGEAIATAQYFNKSDRLVDNGNTELGYDFNIKGLIAISPTVDQYKPANKAVLLNDVNYLLIHGSNDQDVRYVAGEKQYNNIKFSGQTDSFKSSLYVYGANHGQFNTLWGLYDLPAPNSWYYEVKDFISGEDQRKVLCSFVKTFLDVTLKGDERYKSLFSDYEKYAAALPATAYEQTYDDAAFDYLFDFDGNNQLGENDRSDIKLSVKNSESWFEKARENGDFGPSENYCLGFNWDNKKKNTCLEILLGDFDFTDKFFTFKLADKNDDSKNTSFMNYEVVFYDVKGMRKTASELRKIYPPFAVQLYKVDVLSKSYDYKHQFTTVTVGTEDFTRNISFDFEHIQKIEIRFPCEKGSVEVDDIGFVRRP